MLYKNEQEREGMAALTLAVQSLKATTLVLASAFEGTGSAIENLNKRLLEIEEWLGIAEEQGR